MMRRDQLKAYFEQIAKGDTAYKFSPGDLADAVENMLIDTGRTVCTYHQQMCNNPLDCDLFPTYRVSIPKVEVKPLFCEVSGCVEDGVERGYAVTCDVHDAQFADWR